MKKAGVLIGLLVIAFLAAGCSTDVSAKSDETVCVFDGSDRGAQKLKYQILPGQEPRKKDSNDEVVRIPTSFRFYAAFEDRSIADAGAPKFYLGYAKGSTPVHVQGQFKFRFNVDNACEWYARHGRRNAGENGLGFNARNNESASAFSPWVRWLNENFGTVGGQTIKSSSLGYTWPELVYGNDQTAPKRRDPVDISYGKHIGKVFTQRLNASLGGRFFCGTDLSLWKNDFGIDPNCPPIFFETGPIHAQNASLEAEHEKIEQLQAQLANDRVEAKIRAQNVKVQQRNERSQQKVLRAQGRTARLKALADVDVQKCLLYAKRGLDCEGHRPDILLSPNTSR